MTTLSWQRQHHPDGSATFTAGPYRIERVGADRQWTCKIFVNDKRENTMFSLEGARGWCLKHMGSAGKR